MENSRLSLCVAFADQNKFIESISSFKFIIYETENVKIITGKFKQVNLFKHMNCD